MQHIFMQDWTRYINYLINGIEDLTVLVNEVMEMLDIIKMKYVWCDTNDIIWNAIQLLCLAINKNLYFFKAVTKMVQEACTYVDQVNDFDQKIKLIDTLRTVTAGKVWSIF